MLAVLALVTGTLATPDDHGGQGAGIVGLEFAGTAGTAQWMVDTYGTDAITASLGWDLLFILCWSPLLALLAIWAGQNYRTVSTRRMAFPLALSALGAGLLDLVENVFLWFAVDGGAEGAWPFAAAATWGKFLIVVLVTLYVLGGLLSLLLRADVRRVLREADEEPRRAALAHHEREPVRARVLGRRRPGGVHHPRRPAGPRARRNDGVGRRRPRHLGVRWLLHGRRVEPRPQHARGRGAPSVPKPWATGGIQPGPEERHLRANLGYLLSNSPRGAGSDTLAPTGETAPATRAERLPAVFATVITGMLINALVFLGMLWVLSQLAGWFYRWYFGLSCEAWRDGGTLTFEADQGCLDASDRLVTPIVIWLGLGLGFVLVWVLAAKAAEIIGRADPPSWLLGPKYLGYGGLGVAAALGLVLGVLPWAIGTLWESISANSLRTDLVAVAGAVGSTTAVFRLLRKPLARLAPWIGGLLFAMVLLFLLCRWTLDAMAADPDVRSLVPLLLVLAALLVVHFSGAPEFWSLAAFYRGKLRSAFGTYRVAYPRGVRAKAYANDDRAPEGERVEPSLSQLPVRDPATGTGTPLTICASATIVGRQVRTHYGIPALSVTFTPTAVRLFAPLEENGLWQQYECTTAEMDALRPRLRPRLTTMMAVGVSGAAVSPAMGRFRIGPVSMLLAFFNIRLGAWIPNPRYAAKLAATGRPLPRPGLGYLLKEFFGFLDPSDLYLYVTDGGHWENTALVELLRTCHHREIVCVDADSGPGNLAKSISRAIDLAAAGVRGERGAQPRRPPRRPRPLPRPRLRTPVGEPRPGSPPRRERRADQRALVLQAGPDPGHATAAAGLPGGRPDVPAGEHRQPVLPRRAVPAYRNLGRFNARKVLSARATLVAEVARHETFSGFRAAVEDQPAGPFAELAEVVSTFTGQQPREEPAEPWVLPELVALIDQLSLDRVPSERVAYAEELYATVRATLLPGAGSARGRHLMQWPTSGAS